VPPFCSLRGGAVLYSGLSFRLVPLSDDHDAHGAHSGGESARNTTRTQAHPQHHPGPECVDAERACAAAARRCT
jgi:hypothetical protein